MPKQGYRADDEGAVRLFYLSVSVVYAAGFAWVVLSYTVGTNTSVFCPLKALTGWPCPFCDLTHALHFLLEGNVGLALTVNPLVVFAPVALLYPLVALDWKSGRRYLWALYCRFRVPVIAAAAVIVAAVWVYKILTTTTITNILV